MIVLREKTTVEVSEEGYEWKVVTQWLKDGRRIRKYVVNYIDGREVSRYYS